MTDPIQIYDWVEPWGEGIVAEVVEIRTNHDGRPAYLCRWIDHRSYVEWHTNVDLNRRRPPLLGCHLTHMPWRNP
jgi:hypothetical protein